MSHFSVLVVGNTEDVESKLAPYHEYECTGERDQYVVEIDKTADTLRRYETEKEREYEDEDMRKPTLEESKFLEGIDRTEMHGKVSTGEGTGLLWMVEGRDGLMVKGFTETPVKENYTLRRYFEDWLGLEYIYEVGEEVDEEEAKFGYAIFDGEKLVKHVDITNPNRKWDWWVVGGGWNGALLTKDGSEVNQAKVKDVDVSLVRARAAENTRKVFEEYKDILDFEGYRTFEEVIRDGVCRDDYNDQPLCAALRKRNLKTRYWMEPEDLCGGSLDAMIERAKRNAFCFFAVVTEEGEWKERGKMGWFACVSNENEDWEDEFARYWDSLDPETYVTVVDCHI